MTRRRQTRRQQAEERPETLGFLSFLREIERSAPDSPRIGRNMLLADEVVKLRQDPFVVFPDGDITEVRSAPDLPVEVNTRVLGYFGPQGALPLHLTVEMMRGVKAGGGEAAFVQFAEIFSARFLQLLFRAWSDARAITQYDHPADDRFQTYLGAFMGMASPALRAQAAQAGFSVSTLPLAGVIGARIRSPVRLRQILEHLVGIPLSVEENIPIWLNFEPEDQNRLGLSGSTIGDDCMLGQQTLSVNDRICLHIDCPDLTTYLKFLPGGAGFRQIVSVCDVYLGVQTSVEIAPALPAAEVPALVLDGSAAIGWTAWLDPTSRDEDWWRDAVFDTHPTWSEVPWRDHLHPPEEFMR